MKQKVRIALAGNPNVGKSTVFNALTGMHQHTGNWPGKTVGSATGEYVYRGKSYEIVDLPGTYSLISHSEEETVARDFICFGDYDVALVVCDAVCLERNLNLVLQVLEITSNVIVVVNLMDEAKKKKIEIDLAKLSSLLRVPVIGTAARSKQGLPELMEAISEMSQAKKQWNSFSCPYTPEIESAIHKVETCLLRKDLRGLSSRFVALKLIDDDPIILDSLVEHLDFSMNEASFLEGIEAARLELLEADILVHEFKEKIVKQLVLEGEKIASQVVTFHHPDYEKRNRKIDRLLTNKWTGIPLMLFLFMGIFWITITGANYPSSVLFDFFQGLEGRLFSFFVAMHVPDWINSLLLSGVYRTLTWVVSVMLPPMAIFFPLFTILEDLGYLPRIAFNLDRCFQKCSACGKQALTMAMGFGCNAVGVTGCRIIDSPRERLIAILTNNFVPCNGRFPTMISIITMFFVGFSASVSSSFLETFFLTGVILLGVFMTLFVSHLLSRTILKGVPSSFTLELPPYRKPQFCKVIIRSIFDRTLFVLGRAVAVAIPAGVLIWIMANVHVGGISLLSHVSSFLDPFAQVIGLDGVILTAFILGFPANEIVVPIIIMAYMATGSMTDFTSLVELKTLLLQNGWTSLTAICTILFSLMHWPCSTTCLTIKKETGSWKWTALSFLIPTVCGCVLCFLVATIYRLIF